jgi:hypothetical protein
LTLTSKITNQQNQKAAQIQNDVQDTVRDISQAVDSNSAMDPAIAAVWARLRGKSCARTIAIAMMATWVRTKSTSPMMEKATCAKNTPPAAKKVMIAATCTKVKRTFSMTRRISWIQNAAWLKTRIGSSPIARAASMTAVVTATVAEAYRWN